jgi:hypothetical protein
VIGKGELAALLNRLLRPLDVALVRRSELWRMTGQLSRQPRPEAAQPPRPPRLRQFGPARAGYDFAVVMPSLLRPTIAQALRSVFAQEFSGTVQTLVGIDVPLGDARAIEAACRDRPDSHTLLLLDPGYSTSVRHGGLHPAWDGGALRTVLSYLAASRRVAYLDDDNWWAPGHLGSLGAALQGHDFAWAERIHVDRATRVPGAPIPPDGFIDPNCLAIDKLACEALLRWWGLPKRDSGSGIDADRQVSRFLTEQFRGRGTGQASVYYAMREPLARDRPGGQSPRPAKLAARGWAG